MTPPPSWVALVSTLEIYAGTVFGLGIAIVYAFTAKFWDSVAGRIIMGLAVSLGSLLLHIALFRWTGDYPGRVYVGLGLFTVLVVVLGALFVLLVRIQVLPRLRSRPGIRRERK